MPQDRRSFIRRFGITLGSLIASGSLPGCGKKKERGSSKTEGQVKEQDKPSATPTAEGQVTKQDQPSPTPRRPAWEELRQCWLKLDTLDDDITKARGLGGRFPTEEAVNQKARIAVHRAWLQHLVAEGELKEPVARHMQAAFEEAVYHVVRSMATCYLIFPFDGQVRNDLLTQADVLRKISGDVEPATVAKAQAAIAQDVAFFEIFKAGPKDHRSLESHYRTGTLKVSPEALEAAHLLTQLFLERPG
jgi:hypothetical protein